MKDMSIPRQAKEVVTAYDHSLERQIVGQGSSFACKDEELWRQVEGLLENGGAKETHCLGLDPLRVMEESLTAATTAAAASTGRIRGRGRLQGLERAFEVLEQAALNLYLCPWREEYKVVKMYSGLFTHFIKPVLSMPQIEKLFGLLGYQPTSSRHEQLCLQSSRGIPPTLDDLLCLSCAFFLARCECRLLLTALGEHTGEVQWELNVVRERQAGNSLQVAVDNTKKLLDVEQQADTDTDVDLYTDEQENSVPRREVVNQDDSPRSLALESQSSHGDYPGIKTQSNGMMSLPPSSSLSTREQLCVSTYNCQLKTSTAESETSRSSMTRARQRRHQAEALQSQSLQMEVCRSETADNHECHCLQSPHLAAKFCRDCNSIHDIDCSMLQQCIRENHHMSFPDNPTDVIKELRAVPHAESVRMSSTALTSSSSTISSLSLQDGPKSIAPITYHDCCDLAHPDPQVLCVSCSVFHTSLCKGIYFCEKEDHGIRRLGVCSCGKESSRDPLVLCRYCGKVYCKDCWYRQPLKCACGQTFDQSSSV